MSRPIAICVDCQLAGVVVEPCCYQLTGGLIGGVAWIVKPPALADLPVPTKPSDAPMLAADWRPVSRASRLHLLARVGPVPEVEDVNEGGW